MQNTACKIIPFVTTPVCNNVETVKSGLEDVEAATISLAPTRACDNVESNDLGSLAHAMILL